MIMDINTDNYINGIYRRCIESSNENIIMKITNYLCKKEFLKTDKWYDIFVVDGFVLLMTQLRLR